MAPRLRICASTTTAPEPVSASSEIELMPGVAWGRPDILFTPAFWKDQVALYEATFQPLRHRLSDTLKSECVACLLGGHGIPAEVGLAAFDALKRSRLLCGHTVSHLEILGVLERPIQLSSGRSVRYRFAAQKSRYVAEFINTFRDPMTSDHVEIRDYLTTHRGIGLKTASWIVRNWFDSNEVAILDIHIIRAGLIAGFFEQHQDVAKDYIPMEKAFLHFARRIGVLPSSLDAVIWQQMRAAGDVVHRLLNGYHAPLTPGCIAA